MAKQARNHTPKPRLATHPSLTHAHSAVRKHTNIHKHEQYTAATLPLICKCKFGICVEHVSKWLIKKKSQIWLIWAQK